MDLNYVYAELSVWRAIDFYLTLVAAVVAVSWVFFYLFGQVLLSLIRVKAEELAWFAGLWAFVSVSILLGLVGCFTLPVLCIWAAIIVLTSYFRGLRSFPPVFAFWRTSSEGKWILAGCLLTACMIGSIGFSHLVPWFDGNFMASAGHLARTGWFNPALTDGQFGITILVATLNLFFPTLSAVSASVGWGWLYGPFLFLGMISLLRAITGGNRWLPLALFIFAFPTGFKAHEIRAAVSAMGLVIWAAAFLIRYLKSARSPAAWRDANFLGAVLCLASAWSFHELVAIYSFLTLLAVSVFFFARGRREEFRRVWRAFLWISLLEYFIIALGFSWALGGAPLLKSLLPGTGCALLAFGMTRVRGLSAGSSSRKLKLNPGFGLLFVVLALLALWQSPWSAPAYNWYFFNTVQWFGSFNFSSYGIPGFLFAVALLLSGVEVFASKTPSLSALILAVGFSVSCFFQFLAPLLLKAGVSVFLPERAFLWDVWKDTALHWNNPFMVLALVYLLERLAGRFHWIDIRLTRRNVLCGTLFSLMICLQQFKPYQTFFKAEGGIVDRLKQSVAADLAPHVDHPWRGQQSYSIPDYFGFAFFMDQYRMGGRLQLQGCPYCTIQGYGFMQAEWPIIDFMLLSQIEPHDTFVTGDSVLTPEFYLNRQVRYSNGINTVSPIYMAYLDRVTGYEYYWKPRMRIRRNAQGMAYTVTEPERNLHWVEKSVQPDGSVSGEFTVSREDEYEVYWGRESGRAEGQGQVDQHPLSSFDSPSLGWIHLAPGRHEITIRPLSGQKPSVENDLVVYSKRDWSFEKYLLEGQEGIHPYSYIGLMRFSGMHSAEVTVEEMQVIFGEASPEAREALIRKHHIRFLVLDPVLKKVFPQAEKLLGIDPALERFNLSGRVVYRVRTESVHAKAGVQ